MVYKKRLKFNPDDFNEAELQHFFDYEYQDRGMLKWQGFFLSDHTSALNQEKQEAIPVRRPQQRAAEISELLMTAWQSKHQVILQLEEVNDDQIPKEVTGTIAGYRENEVAVQIAEGKRPVMILIEEIRNIRNGKPKRRLNDG